ncbi:predicted protein [Sclerotinia sclerotiorum 1980 UF-70]|uniref:Uncharacterized protein n=1 Tax=Sclerotinia sclerotiorum (strain ATCC 18683 / 1980 / Ss-1) TaxID=665079 RepID=A7ETJ9_SCLS1|nr:predicted protein [Sclerotinia sclerotiorum 1980 UF-70]EDN92791.1 predicted protein [Sclerotinia sclerotiorum 1980 UF-70]
MSYKVTHARNFPYHLSLSDGIIYHTVLQWYKAPMCFMFSHFLFKGQSKFKAAEKAPHTPLLYYLYLQKVSLYGGSELRLSVVKDKFDYQGALIAVVHLHLQLMPRTIVVEKSVKKLIPSLDSNFQLHGILTERVSK